MLPLMFLTITGVLASANTYEPCDCGNTIFAGNKISHLAVKIPYYKFLPHASVFHLYYHFFMPFKFFFCNSVITNYSIYIVRKYNYLAVIIYGFKSSISRLFLSYSVHKFNWNFELAKICIHCYKKK